MGKRNYNAKSYGNSNRAFWNGVHHYHSGNISLARYWFTKASQNFDFYDESLFWLVELSLKEGNYSAARELLDCKCDIYHDKYHRLYGLLEHIECNYQASLEHYQISSTVNDCDTRNLSLLGQGDVYLQLGNDSEARSIYEEIRMNQKFSVSGAMSLVYLDILEEKYDEAYRLFHSLDYQSDHFKLNKQYYNTSMYLSYLLGKKPEDFNILQYYFERRLFDRSDELLLDHIIRRNSKYQSGSSGSFFKELDFKDLLDQARSQIQAMNPSHYELVDFYAIYVDRPVGWVDGKETSCVRVVTLLGTKDIVTMYPVSLSLEYDREGMSVSKQLKLTRAQGGQVL